MHKRPLAPAPEQYRAPIRLLSSHSCDTLRPATPPPVAYFGMYEACKQGLAAHQGIPVAQLSSLSLMTAGGVGGAAFWLAVYPADVSCCVGWVGQGAPHCRCEQEGLRAESCGCHQCLADSSIALPEILLLGGPFRCLEPTFLPSSLPNPSQPPNQPINQPINQPTPTHSPIHPSNHPPPTTQPTPTHPPTRPLPPQVIKSRIQTQSAFAEDRYRGVLDCGARLYRSGGWASLWRGFGPCFARAVPANSVAFLVFERVKTALTA